MSVDIKLNACQEKQLISYAVQKKVPGFRIKTAKKLGLIALLFAFLGVLVLPGDSYASSWSSDSRYIPQNKDPYSINGINYDSFSASSANFDSWDSSSAPNGRYSQYAGCFVVSKESSNYLGYYGYSVYTQGISNPSCLYNNNIFHLDYFISPPGFNGAIPGSVLYGFRVHDSLFTDSFIDSINSRVGDTFTAQYTFEDGSNNINTLDSSLFTFLLSYNGTSYSVGSCSRSGNGSVVIITCSANIANGVTVSDFHVIFGYNANLNSSYSFTDNNYSLHFNRIDYIVNDGDSSDYTNLYIDVEGQQNILDNTYSNGYDGSFFGGLINVFRFNAINPFAGLLALFTDSNGCRTIPTLAGFIGVQNPNTFLYCSWFPASVRNVVTPVIGMFATILVFGFFISWLKGSGSVFTDHSLNIKGDR